MATAMPRPTSTDPQGRQACRSAGRAANQVRACDQPEDRQGARPHDPTHAPRPRRRGDRMSNSAGGKRPGSSGPRYGYPQVNGSERPSRSAAQNRPRKAGRGRKRKENCGLWRSTPARASLPLRARSACAGGAHEAAGVHLGTRSSFADRWHAVPLSAQTTKIARVGILSGASLSTPANARFHEAFVESLRKLGWEGGRNLIIEARYTEGRPELFAPGAAELVALSPDVIVAPSSQAVEAVLAKTSSIPIVMLNVSHPVQAGFIKSLASSDSNVTGFDQSGQRF